MAIIGWNTSNGKAFRQKPDPEKARLQRQEAKRDAKLEREKSRRLAKSAPRYTNCHLWINTVEIPIIQRDRYAFGGPLNVRIPHPKNTVFTAARAILQEYNQADLHRTIDPLAIEALSAVPTVCRALNTEPEVFLLVRAHTFIKLQLKLVRESTAPGAASIVTVRVGSRRYSLRAWLATLPEHRMPDLDRLALELQYKQWRESGLPFRFMSLPTELRQRILLFAVGPYVQPYHTTEIMELNGRPVTKTMINVTGHGISVEVEEEWYAEAQHKQLEPVNLGLLEISKVTREDAIEALWKDTTKRYMSAALFLEIPTHIPALYLGYIRRLELALTHVDFIKTFRCQITPFFVGDRALATAPAHVLSKADLPLLKYLELTFMSTIEPEYSPLGGDLKGGGEKVEGVRVGVLGFRREVEGIGGWIAGRLGEVEALIGEKRGVGREVGVGRGLLEVGERVGELEEGLGITEQDEDAEEDDLEDDDGLEDSTGDASSPIVRRLQRHTRQYILLTRMVDRIGPSHPFLQAQQARLDSIRKTLLLDLAAALRQAKTAREPGAILGIVRLFGDFGAERESVRVLKGG
ncbi:hypothetical protein B0A55_02715 [Friedmanniomyces simplex]|uniref:Uncharacterized protein n=1 Tax=Friedmanniomyces simplex TaxID=329884 RepID=A0A4U0XP04_9PEZI|nr:hypothetical protein B0A55_02715 [Friedmanniomyces simplex]